MADSILYNRIIVSENIVQDGSYYMKLKANLFLLLAALIWGLAFVAQRIGMDHVGPYTFNGVRFALGILSLLPLMVYQKRAGANQQTPHGSSSKEIGIGIAAGLILFIAASLQQIGLIYTTAGKAAFITCLYIILVPIAGIFFRHKLTVAAWLGSLLAVFGLYLLSVKEGFSIAYGDFLELIGALFWTAHILLIDRYSCRIDTLKLAAIQFTTCSLLCLATAAFTETITLEGIQQAGIPILYGGLFSVGIAYTLQIFGQKYAAPSHAAIILSMESVFAAIGGFLILNERLGTTELIGCLLMFAGMLLSQLQGTKTEQEAAANG